MYLDGQQHFTEAVLDISRKVTAAEGRGEIKSVLSQR